MWLQLDGVPSQCSYTYIVYLAHVDTYMVYLAHVATYMVYLAHVATVIWCT